MRNLTKKFRIKRNRKKFSLENNNSRNGLDKQLKPISVVLEKVKFHDNHSSTSWFQEEVNTDSCETTPTREDAAFSLSRDVSESSARRETANTSKPFSSSKSVVEVSEERHQAEKWSKDVIFEAEQLVLKAEIENLRNQADKEQKYNKVGKETKENKFITKRASSLSEVEEHHHLPDPTATRSSEQIDAPTKQRRSTFSNISRKFGNFSLSKSTESLPNKPKNKIHKSTSEFEKNAQSIETEEEMAGKSSNAAPDDLKRWSVLTAEYDSGTESSGKGTENTTAITKQQRRSKFSKVSRKLEKFTSKSMESLSHNEFVPDHSKIRVRQSVSERDLRGVIPAESMERIEAHGTEGSSQNSGRSDKAKLDLEKRSSLPIAEHNCKASAHHKSARSSKGPRKLGRFTSKSMETLSHDKSGDKFMTCESKNKSDLQLNIQHVQSVAYQEVDGRDDSASGQSQNNHKGEAKLEKWLSLPVIPEYDITESKHHKTAPTSTVSKKLGRFTSKSMEVLSKHELENQLQIRESKTNRDITLIEEGSMALLRAAKNNSIHQANSLLSHGISPEILDHRGWTPLCVALEHDNLKCAHVLVCWNANVNFIHEDGTSILHHMTSMGSYKAITFLLRRGVDVNVEDSKGWPAVHYGLQGNHLKCSALLLAGGVNSEAYTRKRVDEFKAVIKMSTAGKWTYQLQNVLEIDVENKVEL